MFFLYSKYSKSDNKTQKSITKYLMNELSGKVIRVVDKKNSIFMTDQEIRRSVQMRFKNHVSYKIIKIYMLGFVNVFMIHRVKIYQKMLTILMIYQII